MNMNWIYHIDCVSRKKVYDVAYAEVLKSGEWFATPTLAREAQEKAIKKALEVEATEEPEEIAEIEQVEEIEEEKPAKPRKVKANGNSKRADKRSVQDA